MPEGYLGHPSDPSTIPLTGIGDNGCKLQMDSVVTKIQKEDGIQTISWNQTSAWQFATKSCVRFSNTTTYHHQPTWQTAYPVLCLCLPVLSMSIGSSETWIKVSGLPSWCFTWAVLWYLAKEAGRVGKSSWFLGNVQWSMNWSRIFSEVKQLCWVSQFMQLLVSLVGCRLDWFTMGPLRVYSCFNFFNPVPSVFSCSWMKSTHHVLPPDLHSGICNDVL